jgi:hypothetical protein
MIERERELGNNTWYGVWFSGWLAGPSLQDCELAWAVSLDYGSGMKL